MSALVESDPESACKQAVCLLHLPILDIQGAAWILRCSIERVYRIPENELPRSHGPGKHCLFLMDDIVSYVRALIKKGGCADDMTLSERSKQADFLADGIRKPPRKKQ